MCLALTPQAADVAEHDTFVHTTSTRYVAIEIRRRILHKVATFRTNRVQRVVKLQNVPSQ